MSEDLLRIEVATCVRMLEYLGLIDFSGHVSCRIPGMRTILINPWGASRHSLGPQDIVKASLSGEPLEEGVELPLEIHIHTSIYRRRPDVNAVTHLHPPVTTALSAAGKEYLPVVYHGAIFAAGVSVYDDCCHVNTVQKGDALAAVLGPRRAAIMRGHGAVVAAESVKGAFLGSVYLEDNAKTLLDAYKMGDPRPLREDELRAGEHIWRQATFEKIWTYYREKSGIRFA
ncbi:MAG: class II aldolase/adducin family protein [Thermodesulfobacteriota bacterium]